MADGLLCSLMSVAVAVKTSGSGYEVGSVTSGKERMEGRDFLRIAFDSFDVDKSGYIDPQELRAALTMLGVRKPGTGEDTMALMNLDDVDGDGTISLQDLDQNGDEKIDFEEFKVFAAILPKRDHPIYRNALLSRPVVLPRDEGKATAVQLDQKAAQDKTKEALNNALRKLKDKLRLQERHLDKTSRGDTKLLLAFQQLDKSGDGRVDRKELLSFLSDGSDEELSKHEAWVLMNCADTNNDQHMTFDEFKVMMQTVAVGV